MIDPHRCRSDRPRARLLATNAICWFGGLWIGGLLAATVPPAVAEPPPSAFLDCDGCDFSYLRREIPFVSWVRDREDAIVHVLVTDTRTAAGGREYTLDFIGLKAQAGTDQNLRYVAPPDYTDDEERSGLARILRIGLLPYLAHSPILSQLSVSYDGGGGAETTSAPTADPWDNWVFAVEGGGWIEKQAQRTEFSVDASVSADRVTEQWRVRSRANFDYDEDRFESSVVDSSTTPPTASTSATTSTSHSWEYWGMAVKSLGPHWSAGVSGSIESDTYNNTDLGLRLAPAVEYSYWSYEQDQRRRLTFAYRIGTRRSDYVERTIFGKMSETRFDQSLNIDLGLTQPWGSWRVSLRGSHYFHDLDRYRTEFFNRLSVRLAKGLSLNLSGSVERINDQLSLPLGEATLEEILLRRRELATDYELWARVSLSYTFGSIYNSVVNTRL